MSNAFCTGTHRSKTRGDGTYKFILAEQNNQEIKRFLKIDDSKSNLAMTGQDEAHSRIKRARHRLRLAGLEPGIPAWGKRTMDLGPGPQVRLPSRGAPLNPKAVG